MGYTGFERLWLFFAFSFFGWVLETVTAAVRQRRFVNRGLVNGPFCVLVLREPRCLLSAGNCMESGCFSAV